MARQDAYPRTEVLVGGQTLTALESSNTHGYRNPSADATARVRPDQGGFDGAETVAIRRGYRPVSSMRQRFGGTLNTDSLRWSPKGVAFGASGPLARTQEPTGIEDTTLVPHGPDDPPTSERYAAAWIDSSDGTIVTGLLALCGLTAVNIADTGTMFATLAPGVTSRYAVRLASDQAPWSLIEELDRITGCKTFDGPDGRVTRIVASGLPGGTPARTYVQGADFKDGATRERSSAGVFNKVTVTGQSGILADGTPYSIAASRTKTSPYVPDPPGTREYTFHSDLIETEELAGIVAARLLGELGRRKEYVTLPLAKGDPNVWVGMTVAVVSAALGLTTDTLFRVLEVQDSDGGRGYQTTIVLEGALSSEGTDPNLAPVLFVTYAIEDERDADGDDIAVVALDSSASYDPDGYIATREWSGSPVAPTPIGDGTTAVVVYDPFVGTPTVTLTATDDQGKVATLTIPIVKTAANTYTRDLWIGRTGDLAYSDDGQRTWHAIAVPTVVLPHQAGDTYQLAATPDGDTYRIPGSLVPVALATLAGIRSFFISRDANGDETGIAWAGASDGRIWRSVDKGLTWPAAAPLPNGLVCRAIQESPYASGDIYAGGGNILYHSYDAGASWQPFYTHPNADFVITRLASGIAAGPTDDPADDLPIMWIGFQGPDGTADVRVIERGGALSHALPSGSATPLDITALTISLDAERLFLADSGDDGRIWTASASLGGDLVRSATYPAEWGIPRDADRDGRFPIVWGVSDEMAWKSPDEGTTFIAVLEMAGGEVGAAISWGAIRQRTVRGDLVWHGSSAALTGSRWVYRLDAGGFSRVASPLDGGTKADWMRCPLVVTTGGVLLLYCFSAVNTNRAPQEEASCFRSTDGGLTWAPADLTWVLNVQAGPSGVVYALVFAAGLSSTGSTLMRSDDDGASWTAGHVFVTGSGAPAGVVLPHPTDPLTCLVKHVGYWWRSTDGGATFTSTGIASLDQASLDRGNEGSYTPDGARFVWFVQSPTPLDLRRAVAAVGGADTPVSGFAGDHDYPWVTRAAALYTYGRAGVFASSSQGASWATVLDQARLPSADTSWGIWGFVPGDDRNDWYALPLGLGAMALLRRGATAEAGEVWEDLTPALDTAFPDGDYRCFLGGAVRVRVPA